MRLTRPFATALVLVGSLASSFLACASSSELDVGPTAAPSSTSSSGASSTSSGSSGASSSGAPSGDDGGAKDAGPSALDPATIAAASCSGPLPADAVTAPALPTFTGTCPALAAGGAYTTFTSRGSERKFLVYAPKVVQPNEKLPVVFLWHWLGGDPEKMAAVTQVSEVVESRRIIAVVPAPKIDMLFKWPFDAQTVTQARVDEEVAFFDDMLACVGAALPVNKECVSSMGVSAGALWTAQLASARSNRLASFISLSGGTGGLVRPWASAPHRMPGLVLWGGSNDIFRLKPLPLDLNFEKASKNLEDGLAADKHFLVECVHNCGHAVPPLDEPPAGVPKFDMVWQFVLRHPYWLGTGQSPFSSGPLPSSAFPAWCAVGQGNAVARASSAPCP
jgi:predicted esterase